MLADACNGKGNVFQIHNYILGHNSLIHPFHILGVVGVLSGYAFSTNNCSLVSSSLIKEASESESPNKG